MRRVGIVSAREAGHRECLIHGLRVQHFRSAIILANLGIEAFYLALAVDPR